MSSLVSAEAWYEAVIRLSDRAEDLADPTSTYVETNFLSALYNARNQTIFGRRGTGKTHLLRRLQDDFISHFDEFRIAPVYIDGATLEGSIELYSDPAAIALGLYVELLRRTVRELTPLIDDKLRHGVFDWLLAGSKRDLIGQVRETVSCLDHVLAHGKVRMLPVGGMNADLEDLDEAVLKRRLAIGGNAAASLADPRSLGIKLDASVEKSFSRTVRTMATRRLAGQTYLPFAEVAQLIRRLLEALGGTSLAVLIDEWSALGNEEVQPLLAHLLRLTARGGICFKLACIPGRTRLFLPGGAGERRTPIGLELGDDIILGADLDSVVFVDNDIKQLTAFFMALLQRHIGAAVPRVQNSTPDAFSRYALDEWVSDPGVLAELCHASSAVPRDFINIVRQATLRQRAARSDKLTAGNVRSAALTIYEGKRSNLASSRPDDLDLLDRIYRKVVIGQRSYFFLVESSLADNSRIVELFTAKLIHRTSATWLDPSSFVSYTYYMIDYGSSIELLRQAGAKAWDDLTHRTTGFRPVEFFTPATHPKMLELVLDELVSSFAGGRLDPDPESLIIDRNMIG
jgi:Cdc6-like AAA superfamily ATPase